jgi:hypothetical protein
MERKTMSGTVDNGAGVPTADQAEVAEVDVADDGAAGAEADGEEVKGDGDGEIVNVEDEGADDGLEGHKLPEAAQKAVNARIGKLTASRKAAEAERDAMKAERDELKQRVDRVSDETVMRAATEAGVLPELVDKGDAARIEQYEKSSRSVEVFGEWLEDNTDPEAELTIGEKAYTRAQVRDFKRQHQKKLAELSDVPVLLKTLKTETADIVRLGMQAKKAGWKPGAKANADGEAQPKKLPVAPAPARTMPKGAPPRAATGGKPKGPATIKDVDDLAAAIESGAV